MKLNYKSIQQKRNRSKMMNDISNDNMETIKRNKNIRHTRTRNLMWKSVDKNINIRKSGKSILNQVCKYSKKCE